MRRLNCLLVSLILSVCLYAQRSAAPGHMLELQPVFAGKALKLGTPVYTTKEGDQVSVDRFRFYISDVQLTFENEVLYRESNSYHLIDAEDPSTLQIELPEVPPGRITAIAFNIGVDSAASVAGALAGDLDPVKGMYWAWNSGYINAKLEGSCKNKSGPKSHTFEFHIGGYMQPYSALRRVTLKFDKPQTWSRLVLQCDAAAWLEGVNLQKENSVTIPGAEAMQVADRYSKMFKVSAQ